MTTEPNDKHEHICEASQSYYNERCQVVFTCTDFPCKGQRYCPVCLSDAVQISAEVMGDY